MSDHSSRDQRDVYVVLWEDRHANTTAKVFSDAAAAVGWAQRTARKYDRHGVLDEELTELMRSAGWLYYGCYSSEGDHLRVVRCTVDADD